MTVDMFEAEIVRTIDFIKPKTMMWSITATTIKSVKDVNCPDAVSSNQINPPPRSVFKMAAN